MIQSEAGFLSVTGTPEEPSKSGNSIADIAAGMYAYSSILAALLQRDKRGGTGKGSHIDVSMLESLTEWMGYPLYYAYAGATPPPRSAAAHATIYPYGPFAAGDGGTVMLGLQNEREWLVFCEIVLGQPALVTQRADRRAERVAAGEHRRIGGRRGDVRGVVVFKHGAAAGEVVDVRGRETLVAVERHVRREHAYLDGLGYGRHRLWPHSARA